MGDSLTALVAAVHAGLLEGLVAHYVYVIAKNHFGTAIMKIGESNNPLRRLAELQTGADTQLTLAMVAEFASRTMAQHIERMMHSELKLWRRFGEWFYPHATKKIRQSPRDPFGYPGCYQFQTRRLPGAHKELCEELGKTRTRQAPL